MKNPARYGLWTFASTLLTILLIQNHATADTTVGGTISTNTTWTLAGSPYIVTSTVTVSGSATPILTIQPGAVIKFNSGEGLVVGGTSPSFAGGISAVGTAAQPILFQANTLTPTPGYWLGITFKKYLSSTASIAYATISHGTNGVLADESGPLTIHHVTLQSNSGSGFRVVVTTAPTFYENNFSGNAASIFFVGTGGPEVRYCWWGSVNAPPYSPTGIKFEPWLLASASSPHYFVYPFTLRNRTFNPTIGINTHVSFTTVSSGNWTVTIKNSSNTTVKTFTGTGATATVDWDGKNTSGALQPSGTYSYQIDSTAGGQPAAAAKGNVILDQALQLTVSYSSSVVYISPNGDGVQESATLTGTISFDSPSWTVNVKNSSGTIIRTATGQGPSISFVWDGKNGSGVVQPDGTYTLEMVVTDDGASTTASKTAILDNTLPTSTITSPTANQVVSNVYQSGSNDIPVIGTATDTNFDRWDLAYGSGSNPSSFTSIASGTTAKTNTTIGTWQTQNLANGVYTIRLRVYDKAGNVKTSTVTVTLGRFTMSQNVYELNAPAGGSIIYSSIVPFTLTQSIFIKNETGQTVRTLLNAVQRTAGTYTDTWNGKNATNGVLQDGPYFYIATATAGASTMTWDVTNQYLNDFPDQNVGVFFQSPSYDPFANQPLPYSYTLPRTSRIILNISQDHIGDPPNCNAPNLCPVNGAYREVGLHQGTWIAFDPAGAFRPDLDNFHVESERDNFSKNAVVLYGTKPSVSNLTVSPPLYSPVAGPNQTVSFTLSTYQNQPASVTITFVNQSNLSTLRTITSNGVAVGSVSIPWDGKANNGTMVSPFFYMVTVTATDSLGQQASAQLVTTIRY